MNLLGVMATERAELRRRQPGMAARGELGTIEREERTGYCIEAEGVAFLDDDTRGLAPDFDDEGFGQKQSPFMRRQYGEEFFCTDVENIVRKVTSG